MRKPAASPYQRWWKATWPRLPTKFPIGDCTDSTFDPRNSQERGHRGVPRASVSEISMTQVLLDNNVVLDVLLDRQPYVEASAAAWAARRDDPQGFRLPPWMEQWFSKRFNCLRRNLRMQRQRPPRDWLAVSGS